MFRNEEGAHCSKDSIDKLSSIVGENTRRNATRGQPIVREDICKVHGCCLGRLISSSQLGYRSGTRSMYWLYCVIFKKRLTKSTATNSVCFDAGKR